MERIKKGDLVQVISGADAAAARRDGKKLQGTVQRVVPGYRIDRLHRKVSRDYGQDRVVVQGVNLVIKHQRRTGDVRTQVGRIELEASIHISNVLVICPACKKATRVGVRSFEDGSKSRYCKKCNEPIA
jgi:large subunit ribosomal protein L24